MKKILTALAILSAALLMWWSPWQKTNTSAASSPSETQTPLPLPLSTEPIHEAPNTPKITPPPKAQPTTPPSEAQRVMDAIDNLGFTFRDHASALGGNPVGTNAEITAALLGNNQKQLRLAIPDGSTVNSQGELCDPWNTPWFFHQLSGTKMEIRSAGPDRILHTADDFVR